MTNLNLLPWREKKREEQKKQFFILLGCAVGSAFMLIVFVHLWISQEISAQIRINNYFQDEINIVDHRIAQVKNIQEAKKKLIMRMELIQSLQKQRPQIVVLYQEIVKITPKGVFLSNIERTGDQVKISGKAQSNSEISNMLRSIDSSSFADKSALQEIKNDTSDEAYSKLFTLSFYLTKPGQTKK